MAIAKGSNEALGSIMEFIKNKPENVITVRPKSLAHQFLNTGGSFGLFTPRTSRTGNVTEKGNNNKMFTDTWKDKRLKRSLQFGGR